MTSIFRRLFSSVSAAPYNMEAAKTKVQKLIDDNGVMVFSKSYCPYCRNTKQILNSYDAKYKVFEIDQEQDGSLVQDALQELTGQRTVPNTFINKKHIGGNSDLSAKKGSELEKLLREAGAIE